jgi:hypothetical protein
MQGDFKIFCEISSSHGIYLTEGPQMQGDFQIFCSQECESGSEKSALQTFTLLSALSFSPYFRFTYFNNLFIL